MHDDVGSYSILFGSSIIEAAVLGHGYLKFHIIRYGSLGMFHATLIKSSASVTTTPGPDSYDI